MRLPLRSAIVRTGESEGTTMAVCSRIVIPSSLAGSRAEATTAGPMPAEARSRLPAAIA
ncbi:hypothetical protein D3C85_1555480 [compost metagenome]